MHQHVTRGTRLLKVMVWEEVECVQLAPTYIYMQAEQLHYSEPYFTRMQNGDKDCDIQGR